MTEEERTEFSKKIVELIRDVTIQECITFYIADPANKKRYEHWYKLQSNFNVPKELITKLVFDCVDRTISTFLNKIDNDEISFLYRTDTGRIINLYDEGVSELLGYYLEDWRRELSKYDFIDIDMELF